MPLTEPVSFKAVLQRGNRVQVPKLIRWQFKMEPTQVLKVTVKITGAYGDETFYARMSKDGRITLPKLTLGLLRDEFDDGENLADYTLEVELEPAGSP